MSTATPWIARRILFELCPEPLRIEILSLFWTRAEEHSRRAAVMHLAKAMRFREQTVRKAPREKKAEWLAARCNTRELEECAEMALMLFHTTERKSLLAAFLDSWKIPHSEGSIEDEEYRTPTLDEVRASAKELAGQFSRDDIRLYLATAGLLMGEEWRGATWPVVDELA